MVESRVVLVVLEGVEVGGSKVGGGLAAGARRSDRDTQDSDPGTS